MPLSIPKIPEILQERVKRGLIRRLNNQKITQVAGEVTRREPKPVGQPVAFFKASTGIDDLSWNSGFQLLTSWGLRLQGVPVVHFVCRAGMSRCVLGTYPNNRHKAPPCKSCTHQSRTLHTGMPYLLTTESQSPSHGSRVYWFTYHRDPELERSLDGLNLDQLMQFEHPLVANNMASSTWETSRRFDLSAETNTNFQRTAPVLPLGALCLPGLRWILRCHHLEDDENTRFLLREYILSAWNVAREFSLFLDAANPRAVVVFNGQFFPEATASHVARQRGLRVITHEVGLQPASAFFTDGEATAYPIHIPDEFELSTQQNAQLDAYLEQRFQGRFSMAGIQFWPSMRGLDGALLEKASHHKQVVAIFTNVVFDTSQPHANTIFSNMFAWLDMILDRVRSHAETLFVIRAHPDETRTRKASRETVQDWLKTKHVNALENLIFIAPRDYVSSYELIQRAKFVMVYNSTIGLEASIMGKAVLCGGRARFTQYPTVFFPQNVKDQEMKLEEFLEVDSIQIPSQFKRNARRFLYFQLFKTSLPFGDFLMPSVRTTQSRLKSFELGALSASEAIRIITRGIRGKDQFLRDT